MCFALHSVQMQNNGMMVSMWGPPGWKYLHTVAHGYPENPDEYDSLHKNPVGSTESNYKMFFTLVGKTLPCRLCRESYVKFVGENPVRAKSRAELTRWLWEIHNKVNDKLGRTYKYSDFESISEFYESFRAKCSSSSKSKGCTDALHPVKSRCTIITSSLSSLSTHRWIQVFVLLSLVQFLYWRMY